MLAIRHSAVNGNGFLTAIGRNLVAGPVVICPKCSESFNLYSTPASMRAAEKVLIDYLRRNCPKHVECFGADERAIRAHCDQCREAYNVLGLCRGEDDVQIKTAYRNIAKKCHPDTVSEKDERLRQEAEAEFIVAANAYKHLTTHG
jgi:hypothetical protein